MVVDVNSTLMQWTGCVTKFPLPQYQKYIQGYNSFL